MSARILVVDDQPNIVDMLATVLTFHGFAVEFDVEVLLARVRAVFRRTGAAAGPDPVLRARPTSNSTATRWRCAGPASRCACRRPS